VHQTGSSLHYQHVRSSSQLSLCAFLLKLTTLEWIDQKFAKTKMGYISVPSNLNGITGIASYYCVILKTMILRNAIKKIQNGVFLFSLKKKQNLVYFLKTQTNVFFFEKNKKNNRWVVFFFKKKRVFLNPATPALPHNATKIQGSCPQRSGEVLELSQGRLEVHLPSHSWIRWEIATSGHTRYWEGIPGFLREPTICG